MPVPAENSQPVATDVAAAMEAPGCATVIDISTRSRSSNAPRASAGPSAGGASASSSPAAAAAALSGDSVEHIILKDGSRAVFTDSSDPGDHGPHPISAAGADRTTTSSATSTAGSCAPAFSNAAAGPARPQGSHVSPQQTVVWSADVENALLRACLDTLNYAVCRDLERRVRSGSGTEDRARQAPCCPPDAAAGAADSATSSEHSHAHAGHCCDETKCKNRECTAESGKTGAGDSHAQRPVNPLHYKFKKDPNDHLGELLDSWVAPSRLRDLLGRISERASKVFDNVIARGKAAVEAPAIISVFHTDGMKPPTGAEEKQLRVEILKEATIREVQMRILEEVHEERQRDSREGGMLASPLSFKAGHLSHLLPETIAGLMKEGVAVQRAFVGEKVRQMILKEIELLEYDGCFNEVFQQSVHRVRTDYMCWATLNDLDREKQQGLWQLFQSMQALPYELNKKAQLYLQVSWVFQLAVYQEDGAYYRRHMDAGFSPTLDNGRKITAVYYPNPADWQSSDGGYLRVYRRWRRKEQLALAPGSAPPYESETDCIREIQPAGDTLVLLRSREMPHEVLETHRKRFAISLWMSGPPGPGDDV